MPPDALSLVTLRAHSALALAVYGEELAHGARVAVFGDATLGLAQELVERGARLVHVYDSEAGRVVEANARAHDRAIYFARLAPGADAGVRDGAFDLVIVPDLSACDDATAVLAAARRMLSAQGAAIIASPNPEAPFASAARLPHAASSAAGARSSSERPSATSSAGGPLGYYELYEAVVAEFPAVRMLGQVPFVGYALAEFAAVDPEPTIDNSLASEREPDWFVALASQRGVRLEPFALIELPAQALSAPQPAALGEQVHHARLAAEEPPLEPGDAARGLAPVSGTVLVDILEAEREAALEALRQQELQVSEERARADQANGALLSARDELALARQRATVLELDLAARESERRELASKREELAACREQLSTVQAAARTSADEQRQVARDTAAAYESKAREVAAAFEDQAREVAAAFEDQAREAAVAHDDKARRAEAERQALIQRLAAEHDAKAHAVASEHQALRLRLTAEYDARVREATLALERRVGDAAVDHESDVARFESQLRDLGREARELQSELSRRERMVRELVATYVPNGVTSLMASRGSDVESDTEGASPSPAVKASSSDVTELAGRVQRMSAEAATREADLVAARWKIAQLERELGQRR